MTRAANYSAVEALIDFLACTDVGDLVDELNDKTVNTHFAALLARLMVLLSTNGSGDGA